MAAKLLLRNLLTVIKKFALPQGLSRNLSFDSTGLALEQCNSYYIAEARRPGQIPRSEKRFNLFLVKAIVVAATFVVAGLGFSTKAYAQPTTQASGVTFSNITQTTATISWTNGNGSGRAAFIFKGTTGTPSPATFTNYTANTTYGSGQQAGTGWYCVFNGTGTTVNITGLTASTAYRVMVVEYTTNTGQRWLTSTNGTNPANFTTAAPGTISGTGTLAAFSTTYGTASTSQNFSVSGTGLTANIVVTPPTGFEVSTDNSTFTSTVTLTQSGGTVPSTTVYTRLAAATAAGSYGGNNIVLSSTGATSANVAVPTSTVSKANLTITATDATKTYGTALTSGSGKTAFSSSGLVNGNTITSVTLTYGTGSAATAAVSGSPYTVNAVVPSAPVGSGGFSTNNYNITFTNANIIVNPATLSITATNQNKAYGTALNNPTTGATGASNFTSSGLVNSETIGSVTLNFTAAYLATDPAGTTGTITPSTATGGTFNTGNYSITYNNGTLTVTPLALTVTGITANNKTYDGTTAATIAGTPALNGVVNGDQVTLNIGSVTSVFTSSAVGTGKTVNVNGYSITQPASNYTLVQPTALTANITGAPLTLTANAATKTYGSAIATSAGQTAFTYSGTVNGETVTTVTLNYGAGGLATATVAGSPYNTITPSLPVGANGFVASNYTITPVTGLLTVNPKTLTVSGVTTANKVYDGTNTAVVTGGTLSGVVNSDVVTFNPSGTFASANVGNGIAITSTSTISGAGAGNYTLTQPSLTARNITAASLNVTGLTANNKVYDATTAATISGTPGLSGVAAADVGQVTLVTGSVTSAFASLNVGNNITVNVNGYSITQPASNYTLVQPTALTANIVPDTLTIPNAVANSKSYDGTTAATISGTLTGIIGSDVVTLNGTGTFASSAVGTAIPVTSTSTLSGAQAGNYTLKQPTGLTADITSGIAESGTFTAFTTTAGTASTAQSFTVSGGALTDNIIITPPTGYELSTTSATTGFGTTAVTLAQSGGTVPMTTVWVRLAAADAAGTYNGNIAISSTGQSTDNMAVTGNVAGSIIETGTITAMTTTYGTASTSRSFTVSDAFLTGGLSVTPPTGFEVSSDNTNFYTSITLGSAGSALATTTVYVRLEAAALPASYSGNITLSTTGQNNVTVSIPSSTVSTSGTGIKESGLLTQFITTQNTASSIQSFVVSAVAGTGRTLHVAPPSGFEVATSTSGPWTNSSSNISIAASGTNNPTTTIYIRVASSATVGPVSGTVTLTNSQLTTVNAPSANGIITGPIVTTGTLNAFSALLGNASASQSFTVSDTYLAQGVLVTPPAGYEVSTDNNTFSSSVTLGSSGALAATTVYVRLSASNPVGNYSGNIVLSSNGPASVNVAVSGTTTGGVITSGTLTAFNTSQGSASTSQSFTVSGIGLSNDITVQAPTGYEIGTDNSTFGSSFTLTQSGGSVPATTVWIRLAAADAAGTYPGFVTATSGSYVNTNTIVAGTVVGSIVESDTFTPFTTNYGTASASQSFTVSDTYLATGVLVTAPTGFEVSKDNTTFSNTVTVGSAGLLSSTTVYARISATPGSSTPSGNIVLSTTGAASVNVPVSGSVTAGMQETGAPTAFNSTAGSPSATQTITVSGVGLTQDIFVAAPSGFELSTDNTTYATTLDLPANSGNVATTTVYIRLAATDPATTYAGNIAITSTGLSEIDVPVSGTVLGSQTISFSPIPSTTYAAAAIDPGATASSGLAVSYTSSNTAIATIVSGKVHMVKVGTVTITANQGGGSGYAAATPVSQTLTITPMPVSVDTSSVTITTKTYNQSTAATSSGTLGSVLLDTTQSFVAVINGDQVTVNNRTNPTGTFANANAGNGKIVTLTSPTLSGNQASNYTLIIKMHGNILQKTASIASAAGVNKVYDGTTTGTITGSLNGTIAGDNVTLNLSGVFATASAGNGIAITSTSTLSGTSAGNYTLTQPTGLTANITKAPLTITANNQTKSYGNTFPFAGTEFTFVNTNNTGNTGVLYASDQLTSVTLTSAGSAANAGVAGNPYAIVPSTAIGSGLSNYNINYVNGSLTISTIPLSITANVVKTYGTALANGGPSTGFTSSGLINGETIGSVSMAYTQGAAANAPVLGSPYLNAATPSAATGGTFTASNYTITYNTGNLVINPDTLTITATGPPKNYGTALSAGPSSSYFVSTPTVNGETVTSVTLTPDLAGSTANTPAGASYVVTPSLATGNGGFLESNYSVNYVPFNGTVAKDTLTVTATGTNKIYDGTTTTTVTLGDNNTAGGQVSESYTFAAFDNKNIGTGKTVTVHGITLTGADAANYTLAD
ncbi:MAG: hypothetical protein JST50_22995, partial [Bacteroidetes bacterium]|nr:hypothetical protein [Bacteroidota bacterium]